MAEDGGRRKSTRNRGEPPTKLRKTTPGDDGGEISQTPKSRGSTRKATGSGSGSGSGAGRPPASRSVKASRKSQNREPTRSPSPESEVVEVDEEPDLEPLAQESIVMLMEKSRQRWFTEGGIFEKFWTKPPRKKKGQPAVDMPSKHQMNMVEIGHIRIIIEPHVFDVNLYGVKKPALSWQPPIAGPPSALANAKSAQNKPPLQRPVQNPYPRPDANAQKSSHPANENATPNPYAMPSSNSPAPTKPAAGNPGQKGAESTSPASANASSSGDHSVAAASKADLSKTSKPASTDNSTSSAPNKPPIAAVSPKTSSAPRFSGPGAVVQMQANGKVGSNSNQNINKTQQQVGHGNGGTLQPAPPKQLAPIPAPVPRAQSAWPAQAQRPTQPPQPLAAPPHPDPVIQMLAQRAASDPALKELMKVVAAGSTSAEKLKEFQKHIDDINAIVARQREQQREQQCEQQSPAQTQPGKQPMHPRQTPQQYRAPPFIASKQATPTPPPRHDFGQVAFDFSRGGDCFLLPRQSVIQHLPDGMTTLISFLVTRKGSDGPETSLKPELEYFQPMTITLLTVEQKIRDVISQVVMPKDQAVKAMTETMERCTLAPSRPTAHETTSDVKRERSSTEVENGIDLIDEKAMVKDEWEAPNSLITFSGRWS